MLSGFLLVLLLQGGCEQQDGGLVDVSGAAPILSDVRITPESQYFRSRALSPGVYAIECDVEAQVYDPQGPQDIKEVRFQFFKPNTGTFTSEGLLTQTGTVAPNGKVLFKGKISIASSGSSDYGDYHVVLIATDQTGLKSNSIASLYTVYLQNSPPSLGMPGVRVMSVAGSDSALFLLTVGVSDSNGYGTIRDVTVRANGSRNTSPQRMFDDGLKSHGDVGAGDGVFSLQFWVAPIGPLETIVFQFEATDVNGATSAPVSRPATNRTPAFVSLNVPTTITRPASGSVPVNFFATVTDPDGLSDIDSVYFRNLSSTNPTNLLMYDDGDRTAHGDSVARDGTYSRIVSIDAATTLGAKDFRFTVVDKGGARAEQARTITITSN